MRAPLVLALAVGGAALGGCRERAAPAEDEPGPEDDPEAPISFDRERAEEELLFAYADLAGRFRTAAAPSEVPESSRRVVRVIDPTAAGPGPGDDDRVHVVDLSRPAGDGTWSAEPMPRAVFERRALAALPPGPGSRVTLPGPAAAPPPDAPAPREEVILYGTSWCGACRRARAFLSAEKVEFSARDIEKEPAAAAELAARAAGAGVRPDRVPVIDLRGKLVIGFDRSRLETLLGEPL